MPLRRARPFEEPGLRGANPLGKAVLDRFVAAVVLLVAAPVLVIIAVAIRLASPGPALRRERRVGQGGREFDLLTFRIATLSDPGPGTDTAPVRGPRITGPGFWLCRYSLDALPQLINVLVGDMSLVGPRPAPVGAVEPWAPRLLLKPGFTGLWPVGSDHPAPDQNDPVEVERYLQAWSLGADLAILWHSVRHALRDARPV